MTTTDKKTTTDGNICRVCGTKNSSTARFCRKCGESLPIILGSLNAGADPKATTVPLPPVVVDEQLPASPLPPSPESLTVPPSSASLSKEDMRKTLQKLQKLSANIEHYFPTKLPGKKARLETWKQQISRAQACLNLLDHPLLQEPELRYLLDQHDALSEAVHALDFTREYTVKLIGPAGAGKSTLLNALLGQDILPVGFGTAVTGVRVRIRLCTQGEPEELLIRFLTREAFDQLLAETEYKKDEELAQRKEKQRQALADGITQQQQEEDSSFTQEWKRLIYLRDTVDKHTGKTYIDRYLSDNKPLILARDRWKTEGCQFITESTDKNAPYLVRLVDSAQFTLRADDLSLLPEGSVWVDLPGGSAGQVHHEAILEDELRHLNAVILVIGSTRYDNEGARKIFDKVYEVVWKNRSPAVAARMIFIVATSWDKITTDTDLDRAKAGMRTLINKLPGSYQHYHKHGPAGNETVPFYPISAFDARMAMLGLRKVELDVSQQQEASTYKGDIAAVYDKLNLPDKKPFTAQDFKDFPHQAMLTYSGLPALTQDLQTFLSEQRYEMQLQHALEQLNRAFQQIEDACWGYLNQQKFSGRDLQKLKQEKQRRESGLKRRRFERLQSLISEMLIAWQKALKDYDYARKRRPNQNSFYLALKEAYDKAVEHMYWRIDNREFDKFIDAANYIDNEETRFSWTISPNEEFTEVYGKKLRAALRSSLGSILEQRVQGTPADVLADMFLTSIERQGRGTGRALDIEHVSFGEVNEELEEIQRSFEELLEHIRSIACEVCRYVTISEYIDDEKHLLTKDHILMQELFKLGDILARDTADRAQPAATEIETPEYILEEARHIMKKMVMALSSGLVKNTYHRIAFIYRYELDKLEEHTTYDMRSPDKQPEIEPGHFREIVNKLFSTLVSLLDTSQTLGLKIDGLIIQSVVDFDAWADFIELTRKQKRSI
jgi:energy-coupling factor transporter ATP-binding protein EcfA2